MLKPFCLASHPGFLNIESVGSRHIPVPRPPIALDAGDTPIMLSPFVAKAAVATIPEVITAPTSFLIILTSLCRKHTFYCSIKNHTGI